MVIIVQLFIVKFDIVFHIVYLIFIKGCTRLWRIQGKVHIDSSLIFLHFVGFNNPQGIVEVQLFP